MLKGLRPRIILFSYLNSYEKGFCETINKFDLIDKLNLTNTTNVGAFNTYLVKITRDTLEYYLNNEMVMVKPISDFYGQDRIKRIIQFIINLEVNEQALLNLVEFESSCTSFLVDYFKLMVINKNSPSYIQNMDKSMSNARAEDICEKIQNSEDKNCIKFIPNSKFSTLLRNYQFNETKWNNDQLGDLNYCNRMFSEEEEQIVTCPKVKSFTSHKIQKGRLILGPGMKSNNEHFEKSSIYIGDVLKHVRVEVRMLVA